MNIKTLIYQYKLPLNLSNEIDELELFISRFKKGLLSESELKAHRVPFGVYEQRIKGLYMIRIRCPAGIITPSQLQIIGKLAKIYGLGRIHITTRQEVQLHDITIENIIPVMRKLLSVGLTSRGGGGNTVRNITASPDSGIAIKEEFDVAPYAVELTSRMISLPNSWLLPRKFKIAFSNSLLDNAYATVNDVGFIACNKDGVRGFRVFVAGGMGRMPQAGDLLHDFIIDNEVFTVAEAIKRVFFEYGNRRNKHSARLRFLYNSLGKEQFFNFYLAKKEEIIRENHPAFFLEKLPETTVEYNLSEQIISDKTDDFLQWKKRHVFNQRQDGLYAISIPFELGDISAEKAMFLGESLEPFGNDVIRFTQEQNILLRNIPERYLGNIYNIVKEVSQQYNKPALISNAVACAGASTCQLGICQSRGALAATIHKLTMSRIDLDKIENFRLHFSGCLNSCGQHSLASLGFFGKVGYKNENAYPSYFVVAGAVVDPRNKTKLAEKIGEIAAKNVPQFVEEFLIHYISHKDLYLSYDEYLREDGKQYLIKLCDKYKIVPDIRADESYYHDWGSEQLFSTADRGTGECAAGIFDLIDYNIDRMRSSLTKLSANNTSNQKNTLFIDAVISGIKAFLITKGIEPNNNEQMFTLFKNNFIDTGLISNSFSFIVESACYKKDNLEMYKKEILEFCKEIETLYASMDDNFQFHRTIPTSKKMTNENKIHIDLKKDLRGVACPMNFVKTKMALSQLKTGQILEILLDDGTPIENVPKSIEGEGHIIVNKIKIGDFWSVTIKKGC
jgi:sulfite reductase (ferredoxin)